MQAPVPGPHTALPNPPRTSAAASAALCTFPPPAAFCSFHLGALPCTALPGNSDHPSGPAQTLLPPESPPDPRVGLPVIDPWYRPGHPFHGPDATVDTRIRSGSEAGVGPDTLCGLAREGRKAQDPPPRSQRREREGDAGVRPEKSAPGDKPPQPPTPAGPAHEGQRG